MDKIIGILIILGIIGYCLESLGIDIEPQREDSAYYEDCDCRQKAFGKELTLRAPEHREEKTFGELLERYGLLKKDYILCATKNIPEYFGGYASYRNSQNYVVYDKEKTSDYSYIQSLALLAHEIGHHELGHTRNSTSSWKEELEAEEFTGMVFRDLGHPLSRAVGTVYLEFEGSEWHPPGPDQKEAVTRGWYGQSEAINNWRSRNGFDVHMEHSSRMKRSNIDNAKERLETFLTSLGRRNFQVAYQLHNIKAWGSFENFSSNRQFGGITSLSIIGRISATEYIPVNSDRAKVDFSVRYKAVDPVNDDCSNGMIYDQVFRLEGQGQSWKITRASLLGVKCG